MNLTEEQIKALPPLPEPVARIVIITLADSKRAKVIRAIDERIGVDRTWIVRAPEGTLLYDQAGLDAYAAAVRAEAIAECAAITKAGGPA